STEGASHRNSRSRSERTPDRGRAKLTFLAHRSGGPDSTAAIERLARERRTARHPRGAYAEPGARRLLRDATAEAGADPSPAADDDRDRASEASPDAAFIRAHRARSTGVR